MIVQRAPLAAALLLAMSIAHPRASTAEPITRCPAGMTLARVEARSCPSLPRQRAIVVRRPCCERNDGRKLCKEFPRCPTRSPS